MFYAVNTERCRRYNQDFTGQPEEAAAIPDMPEIRMPATKPVNSESVYAG